LRFGVSRARSGCGPSYVWSRKNSGDAGICPSPSRDLAGERGARAPRLLCRARQPRSGRDVPHSGDPALVPGASASQPVHQADVGTHAPCRGAMAPACSRHAPLAKRAIRRPYPSQEPSALDAHAGICAGGCPSPRGEGQSLPRPRAAAVKSRGGERLGKVAPLSAAGVGQEGERERSIDDMSKTALDDIETGQPAQPGMSLAGACLLASVTQSTPRCASSSTARGGARKKNGLFGAGQRRRVWRCSTRG
jgi:hypothetical protein